MAVFSFFWLPTPREQLFPFSHTYLGPRRQECSDGAPSTRETEGGKVYEEHGRAVPIWPPASSPRTDIPHGDERDS